MVLQDKKHLPPRRAAKQLGLQAVRYLIMCFPMEPFCSWSRGWRALQVIVVHCAGFYRSSGRVSRETAASPGLRSPPHLHFDELCLFRKVSLLLPQVLAEGPAFPPPPGHWHVPVVSAATSAVLASSRQSLTANQFKHCGFKMVALEPASHGIAPC